MTLLSITRGDRAVFDIVITDEDTGDPTSLFGMAVSFTAKRRLGDDDSEAVIRKSDEDGITITDPMTGEMTLVITPQDTETLDDLRSLYWDLQLDDGGGDVRTPLRGRLAITGDVTRLRIDGTWVDDDET